MNYYLFTYADDVEKSIKQNLFFLGKKPDKSIDVDLINHDGDQIVFSTVFNKSYTTQILTEKEFGDVCNNLNNAEKLLSILMKEDANNNKPQTYENTRQYNSEPEQENGHKQECQETGRKEIFEEKRAG